MDRFVDWLMTNKEWIFSGIGCAVVAFIVKLFFFKKKPSVIQKITAGDNSVNIQSRNNVDFKIK